MSETTKKPNSELAPQAPQTETIPITPELAETIKLAQAAIERTSREAHVASIKHQKTVEEAEVGHANVKAAKKDYRQRKRSRKTSKRASRYANAKAKKVFKKSNKTVKKSVKASRKNK